MSPAHDEDPINLLSLDGGGVRGVSSLVILDAIMKKFQKEAGLPTLPKPCDYFHMAGGTSTGGLIAIMLGRLRMSTEEALAEYDNFATKIFCKSNRKVAVFDRFKSSTLQEVIEDLVARQNKGELMLEAEKSEARCKTFVCALPTKRMEDPQRFRSYQADGDTFRNCKIWEAARATSAAPTYFKPATIADDSGEKEDFIDGAMGFNNPTQWVVSEAGDVFNRSRRLGCVVSIGTGTRPQSMDRSHLGLKNLATTVAALKSITTNCDSTHRAMEHLFHDFPGTYYRFTVPNAAEEVDLGDYKKIGDLKVMTREYLQEAAQQTEIGRVVNVLLRKSSTGLTIGHACYPSKAQVVQSLRKAQTRGLSSAFFTGRYRIIQKMRAFFDESSESQRHGRREFLLHGMGGAGKTQVALKVAEMMEEEDPYLIVLWVDATDSVTLDQSFGNIAASLFVGSPVDKSSLPRVLEHLASTSQRWLMIFDNCGETPVTRYLPPRQKGSVIYTSRFDLRQRFLPEAVADVNEMELDDGISLLLKTSGEAPEAACLRVIARPIAMALGRLPLAIDQAGAYIRAGHCSLEGYLDIFRKQKEVLFQDASNTGAIADNLAVYATFDISYDALEARFRENRHSAQGRAAQSALQILSILCFCHNHGVMRTIFEKASRARFKTDRRAHFPLGGGDLCLEGLLVTDQQGQWDPNNFDQGRNMLSRYSLIKLDSTGGNISMHILVHYWARHRLEVSRGSQPGRAARMVLYDSVPIGPALEKSTFRRKLTPHIVACQTYVNTREPDNILETEYDNKLAQIQIEAWMWESAEQNLQGVRRRLAHEFGPNDAWTVKAIEDLSEVYQCQGRFADTATALLEAIDRRGGYLPEKRGHFRVTAAKRRLAAVFVLMSETAAAEQLLEEVVEAQEEQFGPDIANRWGALRAKKDLQLLRQARAGGADPREKLEDNLSLLEDALRLCGPDSKPVRSIKTVVAGILAELGDYREAEGIFLELYNYYAEQRGEDDLETVRIVSKIGQVLESQGRSVEAETVSRSAVAGHYKKYGMRHFQTLLSVIDLVAAINSQGRFYEATTLMERVKELMEAEMGSTHVMVVQAKQALQEIRENNPRVHDETILRRMSTRRALAATRAALGDGAPSDVDLLMPNWPSEEDGQFEWIYLLPREIEIIKAQLPDRELFFQSLQEEPTKEECQMYLRNRREALEGQAAMVQTD